MKNLSVIGLLIILSFNVFTQTVDKGKTPQTTTNQTTASQTTTTSTTYVRPNKKERFNKYVKSMFEPTAFISPVFSATFNKFGIVLKNGRKLRQVLPEDWAIVWDEVL